MVVKGHGIISCKECLHKAGEVSFVEEWPQGEIDSCLRICKEPSYVR